MEQCSPNHSSNRQWWSKLRTEPCLGTQCTQYDQTAQVTNKSRAGIYVLVEAGWQFTQASHTPFLQPPRVELFTESNMYTAVFKQVLQGTFKCPPRKLTWWPHTYYWPWNAPTQYHQFQNARLLLDGDKPVKPHPHHHQESTLVTTWLGHSTPPLQYSTWD